MKSEDAYLRGFESVPDLEKELRAYFGFYNPERLHEPLGYRAPRRCTAFGAKTA